MEQKKERKRKRTLNNIWIARDRYGHLYAYKEKPVREKNGWRRKAGDIFYVCELDDDWFPCLHWSDDPIELVIKKEEED